MKGAEYLVTQAQPDIQTVYTINRINLQAYFQRGSQKVTLIGDYEEENYHTYVNTYMHIHISSEPSFLSSRAKQQNLFELGSFSNWDKPQPTS